MPASCSHATRDTQPALLCTVQCSFASAPNGEPTMISGVRTHRTVPLHTANLPCGIQRSRTPTVKTVQSIPAVSRYISTYKCPRFRLARRLASPKANGPELCTDVQSKYSRHAESLESAPAEKVRSKIAVLQQRQHTPALLDGRLAVSSPDLLA